MNTPLTIEQLTGQSQEHLVACADGHRLQAAAAESLERLRQDALLAGFQLAVASSFRSYERQLAIFNAKAGGERLVHDDFGSPVDMVSLSVAERLHAILRFSALPGISRHHWGTDLDIFDAAAVPADYRVQLTPAEVSPGGVFDKFHSWLDERIELDESHGFYRPYGVDRGGVAPERWHLSYVPLSRDCAVPGVGHLLELWSNTGLVLLEEVEANLAELLDRYVALPGDWCPRP